jgi:hypothetical protein
VIQQDFDHAMMSSQRRTVQRSRSRVVSGLKISAFFEELSDEFVVTLLSCFQQGSTLVS